MKKYLPGFLAGLLGAAVFVVALSLLPGGSPISALGTTHFTAVSASDLTATDDLVVGDDASIGGDITYAGLSDLNGEADALVFDADGDSTMSAPVDDQIDVEIANADDFRWVANIYRALSGSVFETDTINETTAGSGVTIDSVVIKDGGILAASTGLIDTAGITDSLVLDGDGDSTVSAPTDDQVDVEVNSVDVFRYYNSTGGNHAYALAQDGTHSFPREVFSLFDDFIQQTLTEADTPWILNSGTDAQAIDPAISAQEGGVIRITTGDADGTTAADGSQFVSHIPVQADSGGLVFETRLHINTAITTVSVCAGLTDSTSLEEPFTNSADSITSTATDAVAFCYDTDATTDEWWALGVDTDTDATGNAATGTAPTADTYQVLRIEVDADGETARFYLDGTLAVSLTAAATAASTNLYATVIANATTTTSKTVDVDYVYVGHTR